MRGGRAPRWTVEQVLRLAAEGRAGREQIEASVRIRRTPPRCAANIYVGTAWIDRGDARAEPARPARLTVELSGRNNAVIERQWIDPGGRLLVDDEIRQFETAPGLDDPRDWSEITFLFLGLDPRLTEHFDIGILEVAGTWTYWRSNWIERLEGPYTDEVVNPETRVVLRPRTSPARRRFREVVLTLDGVNWLVTHVRLREAGGREIELEIFDIRPLTGAEPLDRPAPHALEEIGYRATATAGAPGNGSPCERHTDRDLVASWQDGGDGERRDPEPRIAVSARVACSKCGTLLPDGAATLLTGTPLGYRIDVPGDALRFGVAAERNLVTGSAVAGRPERGRLDYDCRIDAPGLYRIEAALMPDIQAEERDIAALSRFFNMPRDHNPIAYVDFEGPVTLAGEPSILVEEQAAYLQRFVRFIREAREALDRIEELGLSGRLSDQESKHESILQLIDIMQEALKDRTRTLLTGSYALLTDLLGDVELAANYIEWLLQYETAMGRGSGGPAALDDDWAPPWDVDQVYGHRNLPPEWLPRMDAGSYGGVLNLANLKAALELAPVFGARELALWCLRLSRIGVDEVGRAMDAWAAADPEARDAAKVAAERRVNAWDAMAGAVGERTFDDLAALTQGASRRLHRHEWGGLLDELSTGYWRLLRQYFAAARETLRHRDAARAIEELGKLQRDVQTESERMHGRIGNTPLDTE